MAFYQRDFDKNKLILPLFVVIAAVGAYVAFQLHAEIKPVSLDDLGNGLPAPIFPRPIR